MRIRKVYNQELHTPALRTLLKDYKEAYASIDTMSNEDAIQHLRAINMDRGMCKFCFHRFNVLNITEYLPDDFHEFEHYWSTPYEFHKQDMHPKQGLIPRISHIEKEIRINLPY